MSRTLNATIESYLESNRGVFIIDLWDIDLGSQGILRACRYSNTPNSSDIKSFEAPNGAIYEALVVDSGSLPFPVGAEEDATTLVLNNVQLRITKMVNKGVYFQGAKISCHKLFPTLDPPNNQISDYWKGTISGEPSLTERVASFNLRFGFVDLSGRAQRTYKVTCHNLFADGPNGHCPYDIRAGKGLPKATTTGAATSGTATTLTKTGATFITDGVVAGDYAFVETKKLVGIVESLTEEVLTVKKNPDSDSGWTVGGVDSALTPSTETFIVGPAFTSCSYTRAACIDRGLYGANRKQTDSQLNSSNRRYFTGIETVAEGADSAKPAADMSIKKPFEVTAQGNSGLQDKVIPIAVGSVRMKSSDYIGIIQSDSERLALHVLSEGRCNNVNVSSVDGIPVFAGIVSSAVDAAKATWGTDDDDDVNDSSAITSGELTKTQQQQAVGSRQSFHYGSDSSDLDTYINNPKRFNDANGDGYALAGLTVALTKVSAEGGKSSGSEILANIHGIKTRLVPGSPAQENDFGVTDWTSRPNVIQFAYEYLRNLRWGSGKDDAEIDLTNAITESNYCQEEIGSTQSTMSKFAGDTVLFGPDDQERTSRPIGKNWIAVTGISSTKASAYTDGRLKIEAKNINNPIADVFEWRDIKPEEDDGEGGIINPPAGDVGTNVVIIRVDRDFPSANMPAAGDSYELLPNDRPRRFTANGLLRIDGDHRKALGAILDCCDGTFIQDQGKIRFVIPKRLTAAEKLALDSEDLITDKGTNPTVIRRNGQSTMKWTPIADAANEFSVNFVDIWGKVEIADKNEASQAALRNNYGETRRDLRKVSRWLPLVNNRDQAARLLARIKRRHGDVLGGWRNGTVTFDMPIHIAIKWLPWMTIRKIASDMLPTWVNLVRIMKLTEQPDGITFQVEAIPYADWQYEDTAEDFGVVEIPLEAENPLDTRPAPVPIESLTDAGYYDADGRRVERVKVSLTLPDLTGS